MYVLGYCTGCYSIKHSGSLGVNVQRLYRMTVDTNLDVTNGVVHRFPQTRVQKRGTEIGILL